jgi:hypothetical protein
MVRFGFVVLCLLSWLAAPVRAQTPAADTDSLKAIIFVLQTRLAAAEKELGEEKKRRAELELAELERARETLDPGVRKKLGLPVPEAPKPAEKPVPPQTPPK